MAFEMMQKMMEEVDQKLKEEFRQILLSNPEMEMTDFTAAFLSSFLGPYPGYEDIHDWVESISLCNEEVIYFHRIIDYQTTNQRLQDIDQLIQIYHEIPNLSNCQLGSRILGQLEMTKEIWTDSITSKQVPDSR